EQGSQRTRVEDLELQLDLDRPRALVAPRGHARTSRRSRAPRLAPGGAALAAVAALAEEHEGVEAGAVAVGPVRRDGVAPDEMDVGQPGLGGVQRGPGIEAARQARF